MMPIKKFAEPPVHLSLNGEYYITNLCFCQFYYTVAMYMHVLPVSMLPLAPPHLVKLVNLYKRLDMFRADF